MQTFLDQIFPAAMDAFLLVMLRVSSLLFTSQIFGRRNIPNIAKIGFCFALAYLVFASYPHVVPEYHSVLEYAFLCLKELCFGVVLGYVTHMFFTLTFTAGHFIDMQMGFGMVNVFDVQSNIQVPVTGNLLNLVMLLTFFVVNGHLRLVEMVYATFERIPVGQVHISTELANAAITLFSKAFVLAINVAMPILASGLLGEVSLGIIVRTVPQMNIFVVGLPLKVLMGLLMLAVILPIFVGFTGTLFDEMYAGVDIMFRGLLP